MNTDHLEPARKTYVERPTDGAGGIARPPRTTNRIFPGWGPKLIALALTAATCGFSTSPARATTDPQSFAVCTTPDRPASAIDAPTPEMPAGARLDGFTADVVVRIDLSASGELERASIARSADQSTLDQEALRVVGLTKFAPAISHCQPVAGSYLYEVHFDGAQ